MNIWLTFLIQVVLGFDFGSRRAKGVAFCEKLLEASPTSNKASDSQLQGRPAAGQS